MFRGIFHGVGDAPEVLQPRAHDRCRRVRLAAAGPAHDHDQTASPQLRVKQHVDHGGRQPARQAAFAEMGCLLGHAASAQPLPVHRAVVDVYAPRNIPVRDREILALGLQPAHFLASREQRGAVIA